MGTVIGAGKYMVNTPLSPWGFISMYLFGGVFMSAVSSLPHLIAGDFVNAFVTYLMTEALPPTSIEQVLIQMGIGTIAAGSKWFISMQ